MPTFLAHIAAVTIRVFGICLGGILLVFSPFAFSGALASEPVIPPTSAELLMSGLSMAVPGATLLVPIRMALKRQPWAKSLLLAYFASVALSLVSPLQATSLSIPQLLPALVIALNLLVFWQLLRAYHNDA